MPSSTLPRRRSLLSEMLAADGARPAVPHAAPDVGAAAAAAPSHPASAPGTMHYAEGPRPSAVVGVPLPRWSLSLAPPPSPSRPAPARVAHWDDFRRALDEATWRDDSPPHVERWARRVEVPDALALASALAVAFAAFARQDAPDVGMLPRRVEQLQREMVLHLGAAAGQRPTVAALVELLDRTEWHVNEGERIYTPTMARLVPHLLRAMVVPGSDRAVADAWDCWRSRRSTSLTPMAADCGQSLSSGESRSNRNAVPR